MNGSDISGNIGDGSFERSEIALDME